MPPSEFPPEATAHRPKPQTREPIDWAALADKEPPARRWAIHGWLGYGHTTLLVGAGGIGKTLLAQQAASCLALGQGFIDEVVEPAKILMWACEDDHDELWRRQLAISRWMKRGLEEYTGNLVIVPRHGLDNALVTTEFGKLMFTPAIALLEEQAKDLDSQVIILDNVAQLYGGSENDRHSVTAFLNALAGALPGKALLLLAHPSRGQGSEFSGSSAWENVARTRLYLGATLPDQKSDEEPSQDVRFLSRRKSNYSNKDYRRCTYRDHVLVPDDLEAGTGIIGTLRASKAERTVLDGLRKLEEMGLSAIDGATSPRFLPRVLKEYNLSDGMSRLELADAMRRLMLDGKVERAIVGKTDKRNPQYGLRSIQSAKP
jgi:RecA-family ATPase